MSLELDLYYVKLISPSLERFTFKSSHTATFRCPSCGDSQKDKKKTRGYFYVHSQSSNMNFYCHNCTASMSFKNFLKEFYPDYFQRYTMDTLSRKDLSSNFIQTRTVTNDDEKLKKKFSRSRKRVIQSGSRDTIDPVIASGCAVTMKDLRIDEPDNRHVKYLENRCLVKRLRYLYYAPNFRQFIAYFVKEYGLDMSPAKVPETPRIIIPFFNIYQELKGFQGRSLNQHEVRYITIKLDPLYPKLFGVDKLTRRSHARFTDINRKEPIFVFEGPFDALMINNSFAMMGSDIRTPEIRSVSDGSDNLVFVYDNEPRNEQIVRKMFEHAMRDERVVVWNGDEIFTKGKDLNEMIMNKFFKKEPINLIEEYLRQHSYGGIKLMSNIRMWSKVDIWNK